MTTSQGKLVLWHRRHRRDEWRPVVEVRDEREAAAHVASGPGGDYTTQAAGSDPNDTPRREMAGVRRGNR